MGITSSLDLFLIFAACLLICASSFAGPVDRVREMESSRSFEFFQLAEVSKWLEANKPADGGVPYPIEQIYEGDG